MLPKCPPNLVRTYISWPTRRIHLEGFIASIDEADRLMEFLELAKKILPQTIEDKEGPSR